MTKVATLLFALLTIINSSNAQTIIQKGTDIDGEAAFDYLGRSVSMPDKNTIAIGANQNDGNGTDAGHVSIYRWSESAWIQKGTDIDGEASGDNSGTAVCMADSNTIAIGAPFNDDNSLGAGHVRIYRWSGSAWIQKGTDIDRETLGDQFGRSVSMPDSNTVAIGAPFNDGNGVNAGQVRIYRWDGSTWIQKGNDIDGEAEFDVSGYSVIMPDTNTVAIGAQFNYGNGTDAGHVRIYSWNGSSWMQKGNDIDGEAISDNSGSSLSMPDKNTIAIGAQHNDGNGSNSGHVRIYRWNGSTWIKKGIDIDGEAADDRSGFSVSMPDTNTVAIGAIANSGTGAYAGHTRVYTFEDLSHVANLKNEFDNALNIYPNPTKGEVSIDLRANINNVTVIIRNQLGQNILKKSYSGSNLLQLSIPGKAGVYFIEVWSKDKKAIFKVNKE